MRRERLNVPVAFVVSTAAAAGAARADELRTEQAHGWLERRGAAFRAGSVHVTVVQLTARTEGHSARINGTDVKKEQ
jgi:hypothetical protein